LTLKIPEDPRTRLEMPLRRDEEKVEVVSTEKKDNKEEDEEQERDEDQGSGKFLCSVRVILLVVTQKADR
jgi:hypothetical protein